MVQTYVCTWKKEENDIYGNVIASAMGTQRDGVTQVERIVWVRFQFFDVTKRAKGPECRTQNTVNPRRAMYLLSVCKK